MQQLLRGLECSQRVVRLAVLDKESRVRGERCRVILRVDLISSLACRFHQLHGACKKRARALDVARSLALLPSRAKQAHRHVVLGLVQRGDGAPAQVRGRAVFKTPCQAHHRMLRSGRQHDHISREQRHTGQLAVRGIGTFVAALSPAPALE